MCRFNGLKVSSDNLRCRLVGKKMAETLIPFYFVFSQGLILRPVKPASFRFNPPPDNFETSPTNTEHSALSFVDWLFLKSAWDLSRCLSSLKLTAREMDNLYFSMDVRA